MACRLIHPAVDKTWPLSSKYGTYETVKPWGSVRETFEGSSSPWRQGAFERAASSSDEEENGDIILKGLMILLTLLLRENLY